MLHTKSFSMMGKKAKGTTAAGVPRAGLWLAIALAGLLGSAASDAETIYRWIGAQGVASYGNTPPPGAKGVQVVSGGPTEEVSTPTSSASPAAAPAGTAPAIPAPKPVANPALQQMEAQLAAARLQLIQAAKAYEDGKAVRLGNERNYVRYQERVNGLKNQMDAAQLRVILLQRQLQQMVSMPNADKAGAAAH
ncbi:MAG: DUF4124 domain-containing protein [Acidithiobacillus sp.]